MTRDFKVFSKGTFLMQLSITCMFVLLILLSFGYSKSSDDPKEHLNAYCVRECVIEAADSEICDTRCKCAVDKISSQLTSRKLSDFADRITSNDHVDAEDLSRFKDIFQSSNPIK